MNMKNMCRNETTTPVHLLRTGGIAAVSALLLANAFNMASISHAHAQEEEGDDAVVFECEDGRDRKSVV
jgi:hypothetical protein